jgi:site-specific DNA-cytosine methylase
MTTAVSLFAGVGGFDLALERAGVKVVASVEWDKNAQNVLRKQFPNAQVFGDIQGVTGEQLIQSAWRVLDAQYFGVPQRRRRVFIVGCLGNQGRSPEEILAIAEGRAGYLAKSNEKRKDIAGATARSFAGSRG